MWLGLAEIKGIQSADARAIVAGREMNGPYSSLAELFSRVRVARGSALGGAEPSEVGSGDPDTTDAGGPEPEEPDESVPSAEAAISLGYRHGR
ncbi:MAG: helix-hairpin-helix domain-containing protein [Acidimicrobiales bacterium]